jgi:hypothetical protein
MSSRRPRLARRFPHATLVLDPPLALHLIIRLDADDSAATRTPECRARLELRKHGPARPFGR